MAPINLPNGNQVSEIVLPDGTSASEVIGPDGNVLFEPPAPNSVTSRPNDDGITARSYETGLKIELKSDWQSIGAEISNNTSGVESAYLWDSNQNTIASVDISGLASGGAFTFDNVGLLSGNQYYIVCDANGAEYDIGYYGDINDPYPYTGDDLDIIARWFNGDDNTTPVTVNNIGDVGF